jgi:hypothetical protein
MPVGPAPTTITSVSKAGSDAGRGTPGSVLPVLGVPVMAASSIRALESRAVGQRLLVNACWQM